MNSTNTSTCSSAATASSSPSPSIAAATTNFTRSVSQILADSLQDSSTPSSSSGPSGPRGGSLPSAKQIALRARYNRRVSHDDATEADVPQLVAESRRLSYNDALPSSRDHSSRLNSGRYSTPPSSVVIVDKKKHEKRVSFSEDLSSNGAEEDDDEKEEDGEGYAAFATAAAAGAKAAMSRQHLQQQTRRRLSYNDALERRQITSIMKAAPRRHTMGYALDYDTDDEGDDHDSGKCPRRRVSFSRDLVSSVKLIPQITKLQKREMFYRKREIKQFRIDSWLEQAMVISDKHYIDKASLETSLPPTTTKTNNSICRRTSDYTFTVAPKKSSLLPLRRNSASRQSQEETSGIIRDTGDKDQKESTNTLKDAVRDSMSQRIRGTTHKVDRAQTTLQRPPRTIDETSKGEKTTTLGSSTHDGVPSLSGPFFTSSHVMSASALAASNASSSASVEDKIGDWTESLRISTRSRIDAAIARPSASGNRNGLTSSTTSSSPPPSIPTEVSVSTCRRGRRPRAKRSGTIEALAA